MQLCHLPAAAMHCGLGERLVLLKLYDKVYKRCSGSLLIKCALFFTKLAFINSTMHNIYQKVYRCFVKLSLALGLGKNSIIIFILILFIPKLSVYCAVGELKLTSLRNYFISALNLISAWTTFIVCNGLFNKPPNDYIISGLISNLKTNRSVELIII